jgi:hypothetical protein
MAGSEDDKQLLRAVVNKALEDFDFHDDFVRDDRVEEIVGKLIDDGYVWRTLSNGRLPKDAFWQNVPGKMAEKESVSEALAHMAKGAFCFGMFVSLLYYLAYHVASHCFSVYDIIYLLLLSNHPFISILCREEEPTG